MPNKETQADDWRPTINMNGILNYVLQASIIGAFLWLTNVLNEQDSSLRKMQEQLNEHRTGFVQLQTRVEAALQRESELIQEVRTARDQGMNHEGRISRLEEVRTR